MDHDPVKIIISITNAIYGGLEWRARHHTPALVVTVNYSINEIVVALEQLPGTILPLDPPTSLTTIICGIFKILFIRHWDNFSGKPKCFDYGDFVSAREIENGLCADASIMPTLMGNIHMIDYSDSNKVWSDMVKILRSITFDRDLQIKWPVSTTCPLANMPRFFCINSSIISVRTQKNYTAT
jgi:hypothetical protein